jgi:5-methyltetrahydropteroyltriglutamate--homocysteine methyltransferase
VLSATPPTSSSTPELVADRIHAFADIVGRENVIAGNDCGLGGRVYPQIAGPS